MVIKKEDTLYERDEKGNLLPQEVEVEIDENEAEHLEFKGKKILITPMPRGEIKRIFSVASLSKDDEEKDLDGEIILTHCIDPKYDKDEICHIKPVLAKIIVNTIFRESGLNTTSSTKKQAIRKKEDEFGKN